ncbi:unnamed protein product [Clonostachys rosea]|uniref:Secreted protein n=1 Tax=Bionectria ochroleuca TaxID=29856 RepID=A0ABY6TZ18_BIOOC|nr:unnamed protein product [Clonostachys rosea]
MKLSKVTKVFLGILLQQTAISAVVALPKNLTDDQVQADIDAGTFEKPSVNVRPRFRYWVPDAAVEPEWIIDDVKEIARIGASGFELLGYYLYGGPPLGWGDFAPVDWSVYGWGTDAWRRAQFVDKLFKTFAQATKDNGLIMDFAMGPNQGQGVPAEYDDDGKAWDLSTSETRFSEGETNFDGILKGWGTGPLEAAVLAGSLKNGSTKILAANTLEDVSDLVGEDGRLTIDLPETDKYNYVLFGIYLVHSHFMNQDSPLLMQGPQKLPQTWVQNGSWAVDHYSAQGAKLAAKFWEEHVLRDGVLELVKEVGNYAWEDSVEIRQKVRWTRDFAKSFQEQHKYQIQRVLPVACLGYNTDQEDQGETYRMDYRDTVAKKYGEYLQEWTRWTNEHLGVQFSAQVSYGIWMDMLPNIPKVNAPECETLIYEDLVDKYRQYSGAANLAGKRVISIEMGAEIYTAFQQPLPRLVDKFKRAVAGGINQAVIHGSPYSGGYPNTTWPGMMTFGYQFSDCHNRHQPAWEDYSQIMDAMARLQYIFQSGIPRRDVLFWEKRFWFPGNISYARTDLEEIGFSYEYLSPDNFQMPEAVVENKIFAPERQQFKVLVVQLLEFLTLPGVKKLDEYARAGLPIIFDGGVPFRLWSNHKCVDNQVKKLMDKMTELENVHVITDGKLAEALLSIGIEPRTRVIANNSLYTVWREDTKTDSDYVFVYNPSAHPVSGSVDFASAKVPFFYDIWSGQRLPVAHYTKTDTVTTIPIHLYGNQSTIIAFHSKPINSVPDVHVTSISGEPLSVASAGSSVSIKAGKAVSSITAAISDGQSITVGHTDASPFELTDWNLTVEHWDPPEDLADVTIDARKSNTTHQLARLKSWLEVEGLENTSGRGHYSANFTWPPAAPNSTSSAPDGAFIDLGRVEHTLTLSANGERLPPLDPSHGMADIGAYLKDGENEIEVVIATTLVNGIRPIWNDMRFSGTVPEPPRRIPPAQEYGLKGPVVIIPYKETLIGKA